MLQQETDKLTVVNPTESLMSQRDTLLNELMAKKLKLSSEMKK